MRIFLAGAGGVIGSRLIPRLVRAGHVVTGSTRSERTAAVLKAAGVEPSIVDVYDRKALRQAVALSRPEVVIHQLTDLPKARPDSASMAEALVRNARLRKEGTENLVEAACEACARRLIAQSIAWCYAPGPEPHDEGDPLELGAEGLRRITMDGVVALERLVLSSKSLEGLVLRYGQLYGPGTWNAEPTGSSPVHVEASADAVALAVTRGTAGIYNIVDDGSAASNAKARRTLGWTPHTTR